MRLLASTSTDLQSVAFVRLEQIGKAAGQYLNCYVAHWRAMEPENERYLLEAATLIGVEHLDVLGARMRARSAQSAIRRANSLLEQMERRLGGSRYACL